jgi:hypothetical protein
MDPLSLSDQLKNDSETRIFPFRYFQDTNGQILPFVAVTGFFREQAALDKYYEYLQQGAHIFGITAYKSFPKETTDGTEGDYINNEQFDYTKHIKNWLCCFDDPSEYNFTNDNNIIKMSESDFYDIVPHETVKQYDFIYVCLKDSDECPLSGWNAINRNFDLAQKCFPIMVNEFNLKGLVVGRIGCNLDSLYNGKIEVVDMLDYHVLQEKMKQSRFLFVPNIYDASPRVIGECIVKNVPVLMNKGILCGSKYITYDTGEFFINEHDIRLSLKKLLGKIDIISPQKWWQENYGTDRSERKLCEFLKTHFEETLQDIDKVKFIV